MNDMQDSIDGLEVTVNNLICERDNLQISLDKTLKTLKAIMKHQEIVAGSLASHSVTYNIAKQAIKDAKRGEE